VADLPGIFAQLIKTVDRFRGITVSHSDNHPDTTIERSIHLDCIDVALFLQPIKDRCLLPALDVNDGFCFRGKKAMVIFQ